MVSNFLLVFLGGGLGSALRYVISSRLNLEHFYYGTLTANVLGCFLIGLLFSKLNGSESLYPLVIIGFLGGLTTFSSFIFDSYKLLPNINLLISYFTLSLILSIVAFVLGLHFSK